MITEAQRGRRRRFGLAALVILAMALPTAADAHGLLRRSSPAANATVSESPGEIRLTFTEAPELTFTRIWLLGPNGEVRVDSLRILPGNVAVARVAARLPNGSYRVRWRTAGADGHPVSGEFAFTVALTPASGSAPADTVLHDPAAHAQVTPHAGAGGPEPGDPFVALGAILRWLTLVGAVTAIGAVAFRSTVLARVSRISDYEIATEYVPGAARRAASVGLMAAGLVALAAVARLVVQSRVMHGSEGTLDRALVGPMVMDTTWGNAWLAQIIAAVVAIGAFAAIRNARHRGWYLAGAATVALAIGLAVASHAAVVPRWAAASVVANAVHTVAAAGWLGNLLIVFLVGLPLAWRLGREDRWLVIRDVVNSFSPAALGFGALAGATGIFMAWTHVGSFPALTGTDYGRVLLLKVGLLSITALAGAYNWLRVRPALGDETGARRLRRSAGVELAIAGFVLAVTAVLVALPTPAS